MDAIIKCPICKHKAKHQWWTCPFSIEEEYIRCDHCGYNYEFAYGYYIERIGNEEFVWNYKFNKNEWDRIHKKIKKATYRTQHNLRRGYNKWVDYQKSKRKENLREFLNESKSSGTQTLLNSLKPFMD